MLRLADATLSTLPRGTKELGFHAAETEFVPIVSARLASDLPAEIRRAQ